MVWQKLYPDNFQTIMGNSFAAKLVGKNADAFHANCMLLHSNVEVTDFIRLVKKNPSASRLHHKSFLQEILDIKVELTSKEWNVFCTFFSEGAGSIKRLGEAEFWQRARYIAKTPRMTNMKALKLLK